MRPALKRAIVVVGGIGGLCTAIGLRRIGVEATVYESAAPRWAVGRVVLLGDAAHATTPNMRQGACMAIESSVVLARALAGEETLADAVRRYQAERMPRTAWITNQSWKLGRAAQAEQPVLCALRNLLVGLLPPAILNRTLHRAAGYVI